MNNSAKYWQICQISPSQEKAGYRYREVATARKLIKQTFCDSLQIPSGDIQNKLLDLFYPQDSAIDALTRVDAGFSLRCFVSHPILKACQKIDSLFASNNSFTYRDLLPFVLDDDGQTPIILDQDCQTQLVVDERGKTKTSPYKFFSLKILGTYNSDSPSKMRLDNWAYLQTKQNKELKNFLSEFGFKLLSDWALLNRVRGSQLESLSKRDRILVEAFHEVYRRDRRKQRNKGVGKCPDPNEAQLREMLVYLQQREIVINTTVKVIKELKQVATQLRQYDIWSCREPLEIKESETGTYVPRADLPHDSTNEVEVEEQEFIDFLHHQFQLALVDAIAQEIENKLIKLNKSKRYAPLAKEFIPGLQLYYFQGKSLKEIAPQLGMTSWDQARRILNPGGLLSQIRESCVQQLLESILNQASLKGLTQIPPEPDYLKTLAQQIEAFVDQEVFHAAAAEIKAGKNRSLNSLYAQQLRLYLESLR
ncbi:MAG: hypothetical protein AAGA80_01760 [Cyanobacteria bacterium P01_F01_bin.143]